MDFTWIVKEGSPGLGRWLAASRHVLANTGLADVDAELEQFAVDTRRSPKRVFAAHPANQLACFGRHPGTTAAAMAGFPLPVEAESLAVPADDRLRFDHDQCRLPIPPGG